MNTSNNTIMKSITSALLLGAFASAQVCRKNLDINILLDRSESVGEDNFNTTKNFITTKLQNEIPVNSNIGIISFATDTNVDWSLSDTQIPRDDLIDTVKNIEYTSGRTHHLDIITQGISEFQQNDDPDKENYMILITDGYSYPSSQDPCVNTIVRESLDNNDITMFIIGVGNFQVHKDNLRCLVKEDKYMTFINDFEELEDIVIPCPIEITLTLILTELTCEEQNIIRLILSNVLDIDISSISVDNCEAITERRRLTEGNTFEITITEAIDTNHLTTEQFKNDFAAQAQAQGYNAQVVDPNQTEEKSDDKEFYEEWWFWASIGGGLLLITILAVVVRKCRRQQPAQENNDIEQQ